MSPTTLLWLIAGCLMLQPLSTDLYLASLPASRHRFRRHAGGDAADALAVRHRLRRRPTHQRAAFRSLRPPAGAARGPGHLHRRQPRLRAGADSRLLVAARFVQAIGCCTAAVVARAMIRDAYAPAEGARMLAKASSLLSLAPIFGPVLGGYLQVGFGWRAAFVFHTVFCTCAGWRRLALLARNQPAAAIPTRRACGPLLAHLSPHRRRRLLLGLCPARLRSPTRRSSCSSQVRPSC